MAKQQTQNIYYKIAWRKANSHVFGNNIKTCFEKQIVKTLTSLNWLSGRDDWLAFLMSKH
jgi:hypothetical protein